jgi:hypothetical protein
MMSSRYDLTEVLEDLRCKLDEQLSAAGWVARERYAGEPSGPHVAGGLGVFALALRDDFVATAMFEWEREDESDALVVSGAVGIEYEPARDLLATLTGSEVSGVAPREPTVEARISSARELSKAAEQLSGWASAQIPALEELADVEVLLRLLREHRAVPFEGSVADIDAMDPVHAEHAEGQLVPALLACAGRYDEARRALAEYERPASNDGWSPREFRRFVRQLTRVLDAGGELALPTTPPFWPPRPIAGEPRPRPSLSQVVGEQLLPEAAARQEAVKAVRAVSLGKTRDELRALLEQELHERGASTRSEVIDALVDVLATERERFGKARIALRGLKAVPELLASWRKPAGRVSYRSPPQASEAEAKTEPEPEHAWLELPDRAAYPISGTSRRRVTVRLDPAMRAWLDSIKQRDSPGAELTTHLVDVWFTWDTESSTMQPGLNVHIGAERVGNLDPDVAEHFRPAMEAAAERDEDPWTHAHLAAVSGGMPYALEIALPELDGDHVRPEVV